MAISPGGKDLEILAEVHAGVCRSAQGRESREEPAERLAVGLSAAAQTDNGAPGDPSGSRDSCLWEGPKRWQDQSAVDVTQGVGLMIAA